MINSNHEECIRSIIVGYKKDAKKRNIETCQASLARFIAEKEILGHIVNGEHKPLRYSAIKTYISKIWNEDKQGETDPMKDWKY